MTVHQQVVFTALPTRREPDGAFVLSVHVAPRLTNTAGDTTLAAFPDWVDWPATVEAFEWEALLGPSATASVVPAQRISGPPRSDLWNALFRSSTLVRSRIPDDLNGPPVVSFPVANIEQFVQDAYTAVALASPTEHPQVSTLKTMLGRLRNLPIDAVREELAVNKAVANDPPGSSEPPTDFAQVKIFYEPPDSLLDGIPEQPLDFHEAVAILGQHPPLLRLLGLVVDLRFVPGTTPGSHLTVRARPVWPSPIDAPAAAPRVVAVGTRSLMGPGLFRAEERGEQVDGRLPFDDATRYAAIQIDPDGAALRLVDFVALLFVSKNDREPLPSLRSGGLAVARLNRAKTFHQHLADALAAYQKSLQPSSDLEFFAEELTRGFRIDVRDVAAGRWLPLCAREGRYQFLTLDAPPEPVPPGDEGFVSTVATSEPHDPPTELRLLESIFRWGGWSLVAPRPGGRIANPEHGDPVTKEPNAPGPDFPLEIATEAAEGSLPRLRFGRTYQLRARAVDLAGNSVPLDPAAPDPHASPPVVYGRFEPVQSPPVLLQSPRTEGESLERVVLRSNYDSDPGPALVARHIVPPKGSQLLAEQHGMFDTAGPPSIVDPSTFATIAPYPGLQPPPGPVVPAEQGTFDRLPDGVRHQDPDDYRGTFFYPPVPVPVPYLPDPLAKGAALRFLDLPGTDADQPLLVEFRPDPAWPRLRPLLLTLQQGPEAPRQPPLVTNDGQVVGVSLAKGDVVQVRLSAYLDRARLHELGLWQWVADGGGGSLAPTVSSGQHWMVTPYRTLTLVHAVRQPLKLADLLALSPSKGPGQTFAEFAGTLTFSRRSTSQVDVIGTWGDWVDDGPGATTPTTDAASTRPRRAVAFTVPRDRSPHPTLGEDSAMIRGDRHEFGDTRHRVVTYTTVATSRFAEYFSQRTPATLGMGTVALDTGGKGVVSGSVTVKNSVVTAQDGTITGAKTYVEGKDYTVEEQAGTVTFVTKTPVDQEVLITYLAQPIVRPDPDTAETATLRTLKIPSSARPAAPRVLYVVPTFEWRHGQGPGPGQRFSHRLGNGLRVYLDRPWWSSGEGELLGVVIAENAPPAALSSVTRWGVDPVFASGPTKPAPALGDFAAAAATRAGLSLPGVEGTFAVAGHTVAYNTERRLWSADILFSPGAAYAPFVRLALARFQPESVAGAHLSGVIMTDFVALAPDRFLTVTATGATRTVTLVGIGYSSNVEWSDLGPVDLGPLAEVTVERLDPAEGALGWKPVGQRVALKRGQALGFTTFTGQVTLPPGEGRTRLVIEEFEQHRHGDPPGPVVPTVPIPAIRRRLVHSDLVEL